MSLTMKHPGGWCPIDGLAFCTSAMDGYFSINPSGESATLSDPASRARSRRRQLTAPGQPTPYQVISISQVFDRPLELFSPDLVITQGMEPEEMTKGPAITLKASKLTKHSDSTLKMSFGGAICVYLDESPRCLDVEVSASFGPAAARPGKKAKMKFTGFSLTGTYNQGDIYPLAPVLPSDIEDLIVIRGSVQDPLTLSFSINPSSRRPNEMKFSISATLTFRPPDLFGIDELNLALGADGILSATGPPCGVFRTTKPLPAISLPGGLEFPGFYVMLVTSCGMRRRRQATVHTAVQGRRITEEWATAAPPERTVRHLQVGEGFEVRLESGTVVSLPEGLTLIYEGESFMPSICSESMVISLSMASVKDFRVEAACLGMEIKMLHKKPLMLPSINHLMFTSIALFVEIAGLESTFGFSTSFEMATGKSHCEVKPENTAGAEEYPIWDSSECIRAEITVSIAKDPLFIIIGLSMYTQGAWLEPLGLRNFAIVNPSFDFEIQLTTTTPPIPTPRKVAFGVAIYWKRDPTYSWDKWPMALRYKTDAWPPQGIDLIQYKMRTFQIYILYEQWSPNIQDCASAGSRILSTPRPSLHVAFQPPLLTPTPPCDYSYF